MTGLSLFSGAGIGELVFKHIFPGYRTIGYVEWDKYCQQIIRQRIKDGWLDDAPIFGDIRQFNERYANLYAGKVDWLSGGFPCQPFSVAGRQLGEADERNMWPATRDAIRILRPRYCFLENVSGLLSHRYIYRILADLADVGYGFEWDIMSPCFIGAPHTRTRVWVLAYPASTRRKARRPDTMGGGGHKKGASATLTHRAWEKGSPREYRVVDGVAYRVDRLKATGNGWVPQVVARIINIERGDRNE